MAAETLDTFQKLKLEHPPYSPYFALFDYRVWTHDGHFENVKMQEWGWCKSSSAILAEDTTKSIFPYVMKKFMKKVRSARNECDYVDKLYIICMSY